MFVKCTQDRRSNTQVIRNNKIIKASCNEAKKRMAYKWKKKEKRNKYRFM